MKDDFDTREGPIEVRFATDIAFDKLDPIAERLDGCGLSRAHVIQDAHRIPAAQKSIDNMRPDEAGAARHKAFHDGDFTSFVLISRNWIPAASLAERTGSFIGQRIPISGSFQRRCSSLAGS